MVGVDFLCKKEIIPPCYEGGVMGRKFDGLQTPSKCIMADSGYSTTTCKHGSAIHIC